MIPVHTLTINASQDDLTEDVYRDIFTELREKYSLRDFVELAESTVSIAQWGRYGNDKWELTRQAKNDLRRAVMPKNLLPLTIAEAMEDVDPDAEVIEIGDGDTVKRVLKLRTGVPLSISANGVVSARAVACTGRTQAIRKRLRREMTAGQAAVWDKLTTEEKDRVLGLPLRKTQVKCLP